jgi:predicted phage terminase large subunit-like protein
MHADRAAIEQIVAADMARADLYFFARWMFARRKGYTWQRAAHHRTICNALMRVYRGECKRLIINIPPRYSKTELAVINFVAWCFGQNPDCEFIHTSYSATLAANNSAHVRELVRHEAYRAIFPAVQVADDSRARDHWRTTEGGVMYAAGAGGTITGFGAGKHRDGFGGCIIVDDPHKADEARSDVVRASVIDWFQTTLESRKNSPQTPIVLIMQRLHQDDLSGWLVGGGNGEAWEHVCLSAWADESQGLPLWPEKHSAVDLVRMEAASPYTFAGQYRQQPAPPEGGIFKPDALLTVDAIPAGAIEWCRGWDLGASTDGDPTAGAKLGKLKDGRLIIADMAHGRLATDKRDELLRNTTARDGLGVRVSLPQDPGQAGKSQILYLTRMLAGYPVHSSPETGDKVTRAEPFASQVNVGNVLLLRGAWNDELREEMRMFPNGRNDDRIDALSRAFAQLLGVVDSTPAGVTVRGL